MFYRHSCVQCIARKVPELCKAYTPGKADQDLNARVTRLEQIIETALPQFCTSSTSISSAPERNSAENRHRLSPIFDDDNKSQPEENEAIGETFQSGTWYGTSVSGSIAPGALIQQVIEFLSRRLLPGFQFAIQIENVAGSSTPFEADLHGRGHSEGDSTGNSPQPQNSRSAIISNVGHDLEQAAVDKLKWLMQECGVAASKISELLQELPDHKFSDILVDFYFSSMYATLQLRSIF